MWVEGFILLLSSQHTRISFTLLTNVIANETISNHFVWAIREKAAELFALTELKLGFMLLS